jgi:hypothetical protein
MGTQLRRADLVHAFPSAPDPNLADVNGYFPSSSPSIVALKSPYGRAP